MNYWVYILQTPLGRFYIGQTSMNESRAITVETSSLVSTLAKTGRGLSYGRRRTGRAAAMTREREIKSWKSARLVQIRLLDLKTQLSGRVPIKSGLTDWS